MKRGMRMIYGYECHIPSTSSSMQTQRTRKTKIMEANRRPDHECVPGTLTEKKRHDRKVRRLAARRALMERTELILVTVQCIPPLIRNAGSKHIRSHCVLVPPCCIASSSSRVLCTRGRTHVWVSRERDALPGKLCYNTGTANRKGYRNRLNAKRVP